MRLLYYPLNPSACEIRLLGLLPGKAAEPIQCTIEVVSLNANPLYEALSYVWGDSANRKDINVGGQRCDVTFNLEAALQRLRDECKTRILWVDALCINQDDVEEKGFQIPLMWRIYSGAVAVVAWLGNSTPLIDVAITWVTRIEDVTWDHISASISGLPRMEVLRICAGAVELFQRPYWSRMWTYQEYLFAKVEPVATCGTLSFQASALERAFGLLLPRAKDIIVGHSALLQEVVSSALDLKCLKGIEEGKLACEGLGGCCSTTRLDNMEKSVQEVSALSEIITLSGPLSASTMVLQRRFSTTDDHTLVELLFRTSLRRCCDPRDRIFALHALLPDLQNQYPADYHKPVKQVMYEATAYALGDGSNWPACFSKFDLHADRLHDTSYPSWIFDFSICIDRSRQGRLYENVHTSATTANMRAKKIEVLNNRKILSVETRSLGKCNILERFSGDTDLLSSQVQRLLDPIEPGQSVLRNNENKRDATRERLARVLAASSIASPSGHSLNFEDLNFHLLENRLSGVSQSQFLNFLKGKVLFTTTLGGTGVTVTDVQEGDLVLGWVKYSQPIILRPGCGGTYRLVGLAYLDVVIDNNGSDNNFVEHVRQQPLMRYEID